MVGVLFLNSEMDVRFYPPPPSATDPSRLGPSHYSDSSYCNKVKKKKILMSDQYLIDVFIALLVVFKRKTFFKVSELTLEVHL